MSIDSLYKESNINRLAEFGKLSSDIFNAFVTFDKKALDADKLNSKLKELITIAGAHTIGCPYCIDVHT
ncbi:carboxymuconolactone decarboxylase family protein [Priestia megaterium]|uniref:carboxymuconolactone decarboxylase family protein n=1 Tax=Priestia megaterium TaxID=1404 RepID=UPI0020C79B78|nr:carboxymuconolactone decarboxylase family protein [Priestia megaterium]